MRCAGATPNCLVDDMTGVDAPGCCTGATPCKTIQFAVGDASVGDVVSVAAGTYPEAGTGASPLNIIKTLTLCGAQAGVDARTRAGSETRITDPQGTIVSASNVVVDGFNHLTCYKIKDVAGQPPFMPVQPNVTDQFVIQDLQTSQRTDCGRTRLLCVPSSKSIASPSGAFLGFEGAALD